MKVEVVDSSSKLGLARVEATPPVELGPTCIPEPNTRWTASSDPRREGSGYFSDDLHVASPIREIPLYGCIHSLTPRPSLAQSGIVYKQHMSGHRYGMLETGRMDQEWWVGSVYAHTLGWLAPALIV